MWRRVALAFLAALTAVTASAAVTKEAFGTPKEAEALVKKAIVHVRKVGEAEALKDFTSRAPGWVDRDLYVYVVNAQGICVAHGTNPKLVGKNVLDLRDAEGKRFIQDILDRTRTSPAVWLDYTWNDPVTRKLLAKSTYCERSGQDVYCVGIYKR